MKVRENLLPDVGGREQGRLVGEEMDGIARKQRRRLETMEAEFVGVKRRPERIHDLAETTDRDILPRSPSIFSASFP